jgi:hypothetical protein
MKLITWRLASSLLLWPSLALAQANFGAYPALHHFVSAADPQEMESVTNPSSDVLGASYTEALSLVVDRSGRNTTKDFLIIVHASTGVNFTPETCQFRVQVDNTTTLMETGAITYTDATGISEAGHVINALGVVSWDTSSHTVDLDGLGSNANHCLIFDARITAIDVSTDAAHFHSISRTSESCSTGTQGTTLTFTPDGTQDIFCLASWEAKTPDADVGDNVARFQPTVGAEFQNTSGAKGLCCPAEGTGNDNIYCTCGGAGWETAQFGEINYQIFLSGGGDNVCFRRRTVACFEGAFFDSNNQNAATAIFQFDESPPQEHTAWQINNETIENDVLAVWGLETGNENVNEFGAWHPIIQSSGTSCDVSGTDVVNHNMRTPAGKSSDLNKEYIWFAHHVLADVGTAARHFCMEGESNATQSNRQFTIENGYMWIGELDAEVD